jgi:hypothetical protein
MKFIGNQDIRQLVLQVGNIKGNVATSADLVSIASPVSGDLYITLDTGVGYLFDGTDWVNLGEFRGPQGLQGVDGQKVDHVSKTLGTGANGTVDTYTLWADPTETINLGEFSVYNGKDGKSWITGTTIPDNAEGNELDLYFNISTNYFYRKESGVWVFKGTLKGAAFSSDAAGSIADRVNYDAELTGFSFLSLDEGVPTLYFKLSDTVGDWDTGTAVGKGIGIASITKTATVGNVDTYTITYDDLSSSTFTVTNTNIDDTIISTSSVWSSSKMESELKKATPTTAFLMSRGAI